MPSILLLVIGGVFMWIAVSVLTVALCRVAAHGDRTVVEPDAWLPEFSVTHAADGDRQLYLGRELHILCSDLMTKSRMSRLS